MVAIRLVRLTGIGSSSSSLDTQIDHLLTYITEGW